MSGPEELRERAAALEQAGRIVDAIAAWREALAADASPDSAYRLGSALLNHREFEEAERLLTLASREASDPRAPRFRLGVLYYETDRLEEARAIFEEDLRHSEWGPSYVFLGWIYRALGDKDAAMAAFESAVSLDPRDDEALYGLGVELRLTDRARAESLFRQAIACDPDAAAAHRELGFLLYGTRRPEEGERELRRSLDLDYSHPWTHIYLAMLLVQRDALDEAEMHLEAAGLLWPESLDVPSDLADVYARQDRFEEAERLFRSVLERDTRHYTSNLRLGRTLKRQGRVHEARTYLERALELRPSSRPARKALEELRTRQSGDSADPD